MVCVSRADGTGYHCSGEEGPTERGGGAEGGAGSREGGGADGEETRPA